MFERIDRPLDRAHHVERRARAPSPGSSSCPGRCRARRCRCRPWRWRARRAARSAPPAARISAGSSVSTSTLTWKLPSPTWPTIGAISFSRSRSAFVSMTQSASREIGTQTSVAKTPDAGPQRTRPRNRRRAAPARASAGPPRASRSGNRRRRTPRRSRRTPPPAPPRPPGVPWNSRKSVGRLRQVELRIGVAGAHLQLVEKLDARHRDAVLDRRDHRVAGRLDARESCRPPPRSPAGCPAAGASAR